MRIPTSLPGKLPRWLAARLRRPDRADLPGIAAGAAMVGVAAGVGALGVWASIGCVVGVLAAAFTTLRWPGTVAAAGVVVGVAVEGDGLLLVGLLTAAYLILLDGVPVPDGLVPLGVGVAIATAVTTLALAVAVPASIWWTVLAAAGAPLLLAVVVGPRRETPTTPSPPTADTAGSTPPTSPSPPG